MCSCINRPALARAGPGHASRARARCGPGRIRPERGRNNPERSDQPAPGQAGRAGPSPTKSTLARPACTQPRLRRPGRYRPGDASRLCRAGPVGRDLGEKTLHSLVNPSAWEGSVWRENPLVLYGTNSFGEAAYSLVGPGAWEGSYWRRPPPLVNATQKGGTL